LETALDTQKLIRIALMLACSTAGCGGAGRSGSIGTGGMSAGGEGGENTSTGGSPGGGSGGSSTSKKDASPEGGASGSGAGGSGGSGGAGARDRPDAAAPDGGGVPSPGGPPVLAVETVQVAGSGAAVTMTTSLGMNEIYLLKASGVVELGGQKVDAEYGFGAGAPADEAGGMDLGIDIGMKQIHAAIHRTPTPPGPGRMKWFGAFRDDHVYYMTITGEGKPLSLKLTGPAGNGSGSIAVSLIPLSPAPPKLASPLDTVMVPVTKTLVMSAMAPQSGKLYLLQASGFGKVGGGGTHMGDADYMDWQENGAGATEGEAGADFGIGVDEEMGPKMAGAAYKPRARWWGPWRMDHTYYMVFTGTGKPIQFLYIDSGYGDNSPTDKLSVKVFDVP
jgi:hypothetical protein